MRPFNYTGAGTAQGLTEFDEFAFNPELEAFLFSEGEDESESEIRTDSAYIRWVQDSLNRIMGLRLAVDGIKGTQTKSAVRSFQQQRGLTADGIVGPQTEAALVFAGAGAPPTATTPTPGTGTCTVANVTTQLPPTGLGFYGTTSSSRRFGTQQTIQAIMRVGAAWAAAHPTGPRIGVGDISFRCGGSMPPHVSHTKGVDADIRIVRRDGKEAGTVYQSADYSRTLTQELVNLFHANGVARVERIYFNDPSVTGVRKWPGHDNHLHVRFY